MKSRRAMAHVHSNWSYDGSWSLSQIARMAAYLRCDLVLMSEHDRGFSEAKWQEYREACRAASTTHTVLIPGIEYSDPSNVVHILVWGAEHFLGEGLETGQLIEEVQRASAVSVFAHPDRKNAWQKPDLTWVKKVNGIEVWNRKADGIAPSQNAILLASQQAAIPFIGMDFHRAKQIFPLFMRIRVEGAASERAIASAIREGSCYPELLGTKQMSFEPSSILKALRDAEHIRQSASRFLRTLFRHNFPVSSDT